MTFLCSSNHNRPSVARGAPRPSLPTGSDSQPPLSSHLCLMWPSAPSPAFTSVVFPPSCPGFLQAQVPLPSPRPGLPLLAECVAMEVPPPHSACSLPTSLADLLLISTCFVLSVDNSQTCPSAPASVPCALCLQPSRALPPPPDSALERPVSCGSWKIFSSGPPALPPGTPDHCWCPISPSDKRGHSPQHGDRLSEACLLPQPFHLLACAIPFLATPDPQRRAFSPASILELCPGLLQLPSLFFYLESLEIASCSSSNLPSCPAHGRCSLTNLNSFPYSCN